VRAKTSVRIPVIGSLNAISPGGRVEYARLIEDASPARAARTGTKAF
jgi:hypothetical protein